MGSQPRRDEGKGHPEIGNSRSEGQRLDRP